MHSHHLDLAVFAIVLGSAIVMTVLAVGIGLRLRRGKFGGPARDQWQAARRRLSWNDQYRVWWATARRRPTGSAELAPAQLAYARYVRDFGQRSPAMTSRWFRAGLAGLYAVLAVFWLAVAVGQGQMRAFHWILGGLYAVTGLLWVLLVPWSMARLPGRMDRLQKQIHDRHGELPACRALLPRRQIGRSMANLSDARTF